jgi:hypothetical protein
MDNIKKQLRFFQVLVVILVVVVVAQGTFWLSSLAPKRNENNPVQKIQQSPVAAPVVSVAFEFISGFSQAK